MVQGRLCSQAKLNVNTVLPHCTFQLKVRATVKGTRQLQSSRLRHFFVYFIDVQKSQSLLKSFPCVQGLLFLSKGRKVLSVCIMCTVPAVCHTTNSVPAGLQSPFCHLNRRITQWSHMLGVYQFMFRLS